MNLRAFGLRPRRCRPPITTWRISCARCRTAGGIEGTCRSHGRTEVGHRRSTCQPAPRDPDLCERFGGSGHHRCASTEPAQLVLEQVGLVGGAEPVDPLGGGGERDPVAGETGADAQRGRQAGLAGARRAVQQQATVEAEPEPLEHLTSGEHPPWTAALRPTELEDPWQPKGHRRCAAIGENGPPTRHPNIITAVRARNFPPGRLV